MNRQTLDQWLESWARWVHHGQLIGGYGSLMGKMMANKGFMSFGTGGARSPALDAMEANIEAALMGLAETHPKTVKVLRVHYNAITLPGLSTQATRADKAERLGISLKTYESHLTKARKHILQSVEKPHGH
ncbi:hypothetical protein [Vibrio sp. H11]|uniref:hypothetical protein n=1 Tax=Vibrio sp. H11 TaxID=2565928 RepID=UPI0010A5DE3C|nr:hypothetical protein [Vibrio sp. H11]